MKICTWEASDDVPTAHRWLARFHTTKGFLPVFCTDKTKEAVIAKAQAFWDAETVKAAGKKIGRPKSTTDAVIERVGKPDPDEKEVGQTDPLNPEFVDAVANVDATFDDFDDLLLSDDSEDEMELLLE